MAVTNRAIAQRIVDEQLEPTWLQVNLTYKTLREEQGRPLSALREDWIPRLRFNRWKAVRLLCESIQSGESKTPRKSRTSYAVLRKLLHRFPSPQLRDEFLQQHPKAKATTEKFTKTAAGRKMEIENHGVEREDLRHLDPIREQIRLRKLAIKDETIELLKSSEKSPEKST